MTEGIVPFRAWETWYRISGEIDERRPPLVCVHGGPGSTHNYFGRLESLVSERRAVVVYDQLGCGRSSRPPVSELGLRLFIDELTNLRDVLGLKRIYLLGTSWGGMLALEYALTQPLGLAGLVLSSTLACMSSWANEARRLRDEMPEPHRSALVAGGSGHAFEEAERAFDRRHVSRLPDAPEVGLMREESSKEVYNALWGPNEWTPTGTLSGWDVRDRLHEIEVPTLLTAGRYDLCTAAILKELQTGLPHSRTTIFDSSSHMPYLEEAPIYAVELGRFLDDLDASEARPAAI